MNHPSASFISLLEAFGQSQPPAMEHREGEKFAAWQKRFKDQLTHLLSPLPERPEPEAEIVETVELADHIRFRLNIRVTDYSTLPANLLIPHDLGSDGKCPGMLVLHGHESDIDAICGARGMEEGDNDRRAYALFAVRAGYATLAPAMWGWEGRKGHLDLIGRRDKCNVIQMAAGMYGLNLMDLHLQDHRAALDLLASRPEVDAARIGCLGNSTGGRMTMWLSIFDSRVRACIPSGCMNTFRERSLKLSSCGLQYPFGLLRYGDVPELFSLIAPRPMQLQVGAQDPLITPADRDAMERTVRRAYRQLDAENGFDYVLHPEGHILQWDRAAEFLQKNLQ